MNKVILAVVATVGGLCVEAVGTQVVFSQETASKPPEQQTKTLASKKAEDSIPALVDPRVELLSIVFRLIKANEYNQPNSESSYSRAVAEHFGKHVEHRVIKLAAKFRRERGISFDAVSSFAAHLKDVDSCEFIMPLQPWPKKLDSRWDVDSATEFAAALKEFVRDAEFQKFWDEQRTFRETAETRMKDALSRRPIKRWIESYFGVPLESESRVRIGLLNGGSNYGSSVCYPDGRTVVFPTIGVWIWDAGGMPVFNDSIRDTIIHEFCHPMVNPLVDESLEQLLPAGKALFKVQRKVMAMQAYGEPKTVLYESLVRASVVHIIGQNEGAEAGAGQLKREVARGFWLTPALTRSLARFGTSREQFRTLGAFMPELTKDLVDSAEKMDAVLEQVPKVASTTPKEGDSKLGREVQIRIEFDRRMDPNTRGISFERDAKFEVVAPGRFDESGRVYSTTLRFQPGAVVKIWVNRNGMGLTSQDGFAAQPHGFEFTIEKPDAAVDK